MLLARIDVGITTEKLRLVDAVHSEHNTLRQLIDTLVNADEVQHTAKRMNSFDKDELNTFYAISQIDYACLCQRQIRCDNRRVTQ